MMRDWSYWLSELAPWWLGGAGFVVAIYFQRARLLGQRPWSLALFASPVLIWALQLLLARTWGAGPVDGRVAPIWMKQGAFALFALWPLLAGMLILIGKRARLVNSIFVGLNVPAWLWSSFVSWVTLNGITVL
jgi:hypothetical protein